MELVKMKLNECCLSISDGDHQPPPKTDKGIPFVTIANINNNKFDFANTMFVPLDYYESLDEKRKAKTGDVLYTVVGSFGIPVYIDEDVKFVFQRHIAILRPNPQKVDSRFLYYLMLGRDFYAKADAIALGAAQRTVSLTSLRNMEIELPSKDVQKKIADILSMYDKLIENNRNQIKLLEEAAQRLYKEWFVDLHFPGYEDVGIVNGVPKGWLVKSIGERYTTVLGGTPSRGKKEYWGGNIPWINSGEINKDRIIEASEYITKLGLQKSSTKLMPIHTTVLAITGATLGQVSFTEIETCANQSVVGIYDKTECDSEFIHRTISYFISDIIRTATGGAQQHINKDIVNAYKILIPTTEIVNKFQSFIKPIYKTEANLYFQSKRLSEARHRLLSKLMSGELEV